MNKWLTEFGEDVGGCVFADIGASTGGFTDCLLQSGAARVYAVDVGESQLDKSLTVDKRVVVMDNRNARYLCADDFPDILDGAVTDVSFISLSLVLPSVAGIVKRGGRVFALVKPQFECGQKALDKHGVVKQAKDREKAVFTVCEAALRCGLRPKKVTNAPIKPRKNIEYIVMFERTDAGGMTAEETAAKSRILT